MTAFLTLGTVLAALVAGLRFVRGGSPAGETALAAMGILIVSAIGYSFGLVSDFGALRNAAVAGFLLAVSAVLKGRGPWWIDLGTAAWLAWLAALIAD